MKLKSVKMYCGVGKVAHIPECELAPGTVKVKVKGLRGEYWVESSALKEPTIFKHPRFKGKTAKDIEEIMQSFYDVKPRTYEEWEDGFRRDEHYRSEIAIWRHFGRKFRKLTELKYTSIDQKKDIYTIIGCVMAGGINIRAIYPKLKTMSKDEACRIAKEICVKM